MAALYHRRKTGRGQFIDMSQAENVMHTLSQAVMDYSMNGRVQTSYGNRNPNRAPQGVYRCAGDDAWLALSVGSDEEFRGLCSVLGQPSLADDPRFVSLAARQKHHDELDKIIEKWTVDKDHYEVFHTLQAAGVPASPVLNTAEVFADPHLRARDDWQQVTHPEAGTYWHCTRRFTTCRRRRYIYGNTPRSWAKTTSTFTNRSAATQTRSISGSSTTATPARKWSFRTRPQPGASNRTRGKT